MKKEAQTTATTKPAEQPTPTVPPVVSKQQITLDNLKKGWTEKKVDISKLTATVDGKFLNITVGEGWPVIVVGPSGGVTIPTLKSYQSAYDAAMDAKALLEKQTARSQKKVVVVKVVSNVQPDAKKEQSTVPVVVSKKGKPVQHAQA